MVVGGGSVAERKVTTLLEFGASVTVVAPELAAGLQVMANDGSIEYVQGVFTPGILDGASLVIAATDDRTVNKSVYSESQKRGIPVNVVDDPSLCTFTAPAVVRRGDLVIGISTSGKSPVLAQRIREQLEDTFGPEYGLLADLMGELRDEVKSRYSTMDERREAFIRILGSDVLELLAQGNVEEAKKRARECI